MIVIDSQVHAYEANTPKRPWHSVPNWPDHVTGDEMVAAMDKVGVDGAIFISAFSMYRYDASYAVEVQRAHPGRFALVKPVDPDDAGVADVVADWKKTPGAVGIRIMYTAEGKRDPADPGFDRIARAAVRYDFPVNVLCWGNLDAGTALIDRHPDTRFIIDHLGILQPRVPPAPPQPWADLPKVLELAKRPNAVIKVSGACTLAREPYPFPDIWDPLARVFDAWGFDRCLWGTDWTRASAVVGYARAVEPFLETTRLSDAERAMLMGGACAKADSACPGQATAQSDRQLRCAQLVRETPAPRHAAAALHQSTVWPRKIPLRTRARQQRVEAHEASEPDARRPEPDFPKHQHDHPGDA
jgi:L-fuconolactonase